MVQWYGKVPVWLNWKENVLPTARLPLSKTPLLDVTVWVVLSLLVQITVVPALTCRLEGWKDMLAMETPAVPGVGVAVTAVVGVAVAAVVGVGVADAAIVGVGVAVDAVVGVAVADT
jgi:hypothetical protein